MKNPIIGILLGDATGIGPELIAKLCASRSDWDGCDTLIVGSPSILDQGKKIAGVDFPVRIINDIADYEAGTAGYQMLAVDGLTPADYTLGTHSAASGGYTIKVQKIALDLCMSGFFAGFMYAPLNKASYKMAGFMFDDGMRLMADYLKFDRPYGELNIIDKVWTTRVTSHIPLEDVAKNLSVERVLEVIQLANKSISLRHESPRIAVCGLNPHNGDNGTCGRQEVEIIAPAVEEARKLGLDVQGPFSADTLFIRAFGGEFDMVVTMYHDQGQIAMKLQDFSNIVTMVGGMDYPLATPAHGTAFEIAGQGVANPNPTIRAMEMVCHMAKTQAAQ